MGSSQDHLNRQILAKYEQCYGGCDMQSYQGSSTQNPNDSLPHLLHP